MALNPDFKEEALLWKQGNAFVFGIDEAGRGCLAGPVCAAVAAWAPHTTLDILGKIPVRDSKLMTEAQREAAFHPVQEGTLACGVGWASAKEIDTWNILRATYLAVARAMEAAIQEMLELELLTHASIVQSKFVFLTDGSHPMLSHARAFAHASEYEKEFPLLREIYKNTILEKCVVQGDSKVFSIASASILAKVSRDQRMLELDREFPAYQFADHKGYSTAKHVGNLQRVGPCSEHRRSFSPVSEAARKFGMA